MAPDRCPLNHAADFRRIGYTEWPHEAPLPRLRPGLRDRPEASTLAKEQTNLLQRAYHLSYFPVMFPLC